MSESQNTDINVDNDGSSSEKEQQQQQHKVSACSEAITKLVDKIINKNVSVTYTFDKLDIEVPTAHGPGGRELGGAKWVIDGTINISTTSTTTSPNGSSNNSSSSSSSSKYTAA
jgi:hypothetical protein